MHFSSQPGEPIHGRVEYVYPELNMETRTVRARIVLDAPPQDVRPNMLATVSLVAADGEPVLHIPRSALIRNGTRDRVVVALGEGGSRHATSSRAPKAVTASRSARDCRKATASSWPRSSCSTRKRTSVRGSTGSTTVRRRPRSPTRTQHTEART